MQLKTDNAQLLNEVERMLKTEEQTHGIMKELGLKVTSLQSQIKTYKVDQDKRMAQTVDKHREEVKRKDAEIKAL